MSSQTVLNSYKDVYPSISPSIYEPNEFKDKVVIVTGAGSGIGRETAMAFSQVGAKVCFTDWNEDNAAKAAAEAKRFGNPTIVVGGDVTKLADTERLYKTVVAELGEVDAIVCAAGYGMFDKFEISREKDWWGLIETNLKGPTDLTRLVLPSMIKRNTGSLIYISSKAGVMDLAFSTAYSISKAGLIRFVGCLQPELKDTKIQTFAVHPGEVAGTQLSDIKYVTKDYVRKERPEVAEQIGSLLKEILNCHTRLPAWTCVFLATERAKPLRGKYIDATQDQQQIIDNIKEVEENEMYLMRVKEFATANSS